MKIVCVEPNKRAYEMEIENELETLQKTVGGYIEAVYPWEDNAAIICNEEGKLIGLEPCRALRYENGEIYDIICGTFIIVGLTEDDFGSLTNDQIERYKKMFLSPEIFIKRGGRIIAVKQ